MAFTAADMIPVSNSAGKSTLYLYNTEDTTTAAGYFNNYATVLRVGDRIDVVVETSGVPTSRVVLMVTAIASGVVTVDDLKA